MDPSASLGFGGSSSSSRSRTSGSEKGSETIRRLSDESIALTERLAAVFGAEAAGPDQGLSRQAALDDVQSIIGNLFQQYSETALPQIYSAVSGGGGYNSTTGQLLANDAFARTTSQAGEVAIGAITQYEQLAQQRRQISLAGLEIALQSQIAGQEDREFESQFQSRTRSSGSSRGGGIGIGI